MSIVCCELPSVPPCLDSWHEHGETNTLLRATTRRRSTTMDHCASRRATKACARDLNSRLKPVRFTTRVMAHTDKKAPRTQHTHARHGSCEALTIVVVRILSNHQQRRQNIVSMPLIDETLHLESFRGLARGISGLKLKSKTQSRCQVAIVLDCHLLQLHSGGRIGWRPWCVERWWPRAGDG